MHQRLRELKRGFSSDAPTVIAAIIACFQGAWGLGISSYAQDDDGITCTCDKGVMKVKICKEDIVRIADKLRYRLMPYTYSLAWMTTNADYTPMRSLIFDFRTDPKVKNIGNQFMYGPAFMVSPVTTAGATARSVYFPGGQWYDFWTGQLRNGGDRMTINAPLSQIPLHMRAGSIVPMGPEI